MSTQEKRITLDRVRDFYLKLLARPLAIPLKQSHTTLYNKLKSGDQKLRKILRESQILQILAALCLKLITVSLILPFVALSYAVVKKFSYSIKEYKFSEINCFVHYVGNTSKILKTITAYVAMLLSYVELEVSADVYCSYFSHKLANYGKIIALLVQGYILAKSSKLSLDKIQSQLETLAKHFELDKTELKELVIPLEHLLRGLRKVLDGFKSLDKATNKLYPPIINYAIMLFHLPTFYSGLTNVMDGYVLTKHSIKKILNKEHKIVTKKALLKSAAIDLAILYATKLVFAYIARKLLVKTKTLGAFLIGILIIVFADLFATCLSHKTAYAKFFKLVARKGK